jgi:hypothetical protein
LLLLDRTTLVGRVILVRVFLNFTHLCCRTDDVDELKQPSPCAKRSI